MPEQPSSDEIDKRKDAAVKAADPGSNHGVGVDGDEDSVADHAHESASAPSED